jgi:hypothetical protein
MDTELIEPPKPYNIRTPDQLKQELAVNTAKWRRYKTWSKDQALKLFVGVDPHKFDPKSNVHKFYLNTLNIQSLEREMQSTVERPLQNRALVKYWILRLPESEQQAAAKLFL